MGLRVLGKIPERHNKYIGQFWPFFAALMWVSSLGFAYLDKKIGGLCRATVASFYVNTSLMVKKFN